MGLVTLHLAFTQVLANYPERVDNWAQAYIATPTCDQMGRRYMLELGGQFYRVAVADCLAPQHWQANWEMFNGDWIADVGPEAWGDAPLIPRRARLWPLPIYEAYMRKLDAIQ